MWDSTFRCTPLLMKTNNLKGEEIPHSITHCTVIPNEVRNLPIIMANRMIWLVTQRGISSFKLPTKYCTCKSPSRNQGKNFHDMKVIVRRYDEVIHWAYRSTIFTTLNYSHYLLMTTFIICQNIMKYESVRGLKIRICVGLLELGLGMTRFILKEVW